MVSYYITTSLNGKVIEVLILVVVDDGLVRSRRVSQQSYSKEVLILVVVDDGLVLTSPLLLQGFAREVLILVVVDDGLVLYYLL